MKCSHGRSSSLGSLLQVVPDSPFGSDSIQLQAKVQNGCGLHPEWSVSEVGELSGSAQAFGATGGSGEGHWIPLADPVRYSITCDACRGASSDFTVDVFPSGAISLAIGADLGAALGEISDAVKDALSLVEDNDTTFDWKLLDGQAELEAQWKEYKDYRAYYDYSIKASFSPLIGVEFKKFLSAIPIRNIMGVIPVVGSYAGKVMDWLLKVGVYLQLSGGLNCDVSWERESPDDPTFPPFKGGGVEGEIGAAVGAEAALVGGGDNDLVSVDLELSGSISAGGSPYLRSDSIGLDDFEVKFEGLKGTVSVEFCWGIFHAEGGVTLVNSSTLWGPTELSFYEEE